MNLEELRTALRRHKAANEFARARELLLDWMSGQATVPDWCRQELALCTYKDAELHPDVRFDEAIRILRELHLNDAERAEPETLALAGAVMKRKWESVGGLENALESLRYYRAAFRANPEKDRGYGGVNAAYLLDFLGARFRSGALPDAAGLPAQMDFQEQARTLRREVLALLERLQREDPALEKDYWHLSTLAEVHFGLGDYQAAWRLLEKAVETGPDEWQRQTTFQQLISLAKIQNLPPLRIDEETSSFHIAWQALGPLLGSKALRRATASYPGKVGLALSGGGFRASLYHIGVLARLADVDLLREVEVLSTVSGGSIIGTHFYLEVQRLLESKPDDQITREDYVEIVRRLQRDFFAGVQKNLRTRTLASWRYCLRLAFSSHYTHTHRIGELYEEHLFSRVADGRADGPRRVRDLKIQPCGHPPGAPFRPRYHNWLRGAKVPILLLNATSLNSGHNWHFTAGGMGEPPQFVGKEIDINERYDRLSYEDAPAAALREFRLGHAVAASACVPALFPPLDIVPLFPERVVRLVDGGVFDNQGIKGLLDEACTLVLCSDASGQMNDQPVPSSGLLGVPLRSNEILSHRVREAQYQELKARVGGGALDGLLFVHLKHGLSGGEVRCQGDGDANPGRREVGATEYGVDRSIQRLLSEVRTDLDSFSEVEAATLMLSGYLMTEHQLQSLADQEARDGGASVWSRLDVYAPRQDWEFLKLEPLVRDPDAHGEAGRELKRQLETASRLAFKAWAHASGLKRAAALTLALLVLAAAGLAIQFWGHVWQVHLRAVPVIALLLLLTGVAAHQVLAFLAPGRFRDSLLLKGVLTVFGTLMAKVHLRFIDPVFLRRGRLARLFQLDDTNRDSNGS